LTKRPSPQKSNGGRKKEKGKKEIIITLTLMGVLARGAEYFFCPIP
jgi:hypothetical protein